MDFSAALFTRGSVDIARKGQNANDSVPANQIQVARVGKTFWKQLKGLDAYVTPANRAYRRFTESKRLPIRIFRWVSGGILGVVPGNRRLVGFLRSRAAGFLNDRHSIAPAYFKALIDNYECLTDPLDIFRGEATLAIPLIRYELRIGCSYVFGAVFGYQGTSAQKVIDIVYETTNTLSPFPQIQNFCIVHLRDICGLHHLPPTAMQMSLPDFSPRDVVYGGGYANVFKYTNQNLTVAVKILRASSGSDLRKMTHKFYKEAITWKFLRHPNILPLHGVLKHQFAMVSEWMVNGSIRNFVSVYRNVNRLELLTGVAAGLVYMHGRGIIHGDLKGNNILVDGNGIACIADFGLLSDPANASSSGPGGTIRWMSPELLDPDNLGLAESHCTEHSDCYALGMVIYEVLSGLTPFHRQYWDHVVAVKVLDGERPERPQGDEGRWFMDEIWNLLERCWKHEPSDRPSAQDVFECLDMASEEWEPPSPLATSRQGADSPEGDSLDLSAISMMTIQLHPRVPPQNSQ